MHQDQDECYPGTFIVLEGADGTGSSTHSKLLVEHLKASGVSVFHTREPSDGAYGQLLRRQLLADTAPPPEELTLAFALDRLEHARKVIRPALARGTVVVSDRYFLSSLIYQHAAGAEWIREVNRSAVVPDLTVVLLLPFEESRKRMKSRKLDALEADETFQRGVHERYGQTGRCSTLPYLSIDGSHIGPGYFHVSSDAPVSDTQAHVRNLARAAMISKAMECQTTTKQKKH